MPATSRRSVFLAIIAALLILSAVEGLALLVWWFRDPARARAASTVMRGQQIAARLGCYGCHGPDGLQGVPNRGAPMGEVPPWVGGTYMMFNQSPDEIREWILDGAPERLREDPDYQERRRRQQIWMPAYRGHLREGEIDDLVAYVQAVSAAYKPPEGSPAAAGRDLVVENGCFGCHGPEGRSLLENPGSFKGHVPAWDSEDYLELVRSPEEFREWVAEGEIRRFRENPAAAYFLDGQAIKMPAYRDILTPEEIEEVRAYVEWIRARPRPAP
jgi:mono/diheme cytochrome c family protein